MTLCPASATLQAKAEAQQAAEAARAAAVAPLQAEVARLTERVTALQHRHTTELAAIESAARQQAAAAQAEAQAAIDRLSAAGASLRRELRSEGARAEGLAADLARMQDELAQHTQRAATTIELQQKELGLLKGRIRWAVGWLGLGLLASAADEPPATTGCCAPCLCCPMDVQGDGGPRGGPAAEPAPALVHSGPASSNQTLSFNQSIDTGSCGVQPANLCV